MHNVLKTRLELRKKMFPKSRLSLKKYRGHKVTIDFNLNVKSNVLFRPKCILIWSESYCCGVFCVVNKLLKVTY